MRNALVGAGAVLAGLAVVLLLHGPLPALITAGIVFFFVFWAVVDRL